MGSGLSMISRTILLVVVMLTAAAATVVLAYDLSVDAFPYCIVNKESATRREGLGIPGERVPDTGSGCWRTEQRICVKHRLLLADTEGPCE